jgi:hypothetical protein
MTDIAALIKILTAPAAALPTALQIGATIPASLLTVPEKFLEASRPLQFTVLLPDLGQLLSNQGATVKTPAGELQLAISPTLPPDQKQQLTNAAQQQKPVTLVIIPGPTPQVFVIVAEQLRGSKPTPLAVAQPIPTAKPTADTAASAPPSLYQAVVLPDAPPVNNAANKPPAPLNRELAARLATGTEIRITLQPLPPDQPSPPALRPNEFTANVSAKTPQGQLIITAGEKTLLLPQPPELPLGSKLVATVYTVLSPRDSPTLPAPSLPEQLQQILTVLRDSHPALAQQLGQKLPQPNGQLPAALITMLQALQQGNGAALLGNNVVAALRAAGRSDLVRQLQEEINKTEARFADPTVGEWRSIQIPLLVNYHCHGLALFVHQDRNPDQSADARRERQRTRFLINFSLSHFGAMQLDGLAQPKQLDLVIRHEHELPAALPDELQSGYRATMEAIGFSGSLKFHAGQQGWVLVREKAVPLAKSLA